MIIVYLTLLKREPTLNEMDSYLPDLINGRISINTVSDAIKTSSEYRGLQRELDIDYNSSENIMSVNVSLKDDTAPYDGVIVSNGKLCVKSSRVPYDLTYSVITTLYETKELSVNNTNVMHGFKYCGLRLYTTGLDGMKLSDTRQELNMYTAMLTNVYTAAHSYNVDIRVRHEMQALQQYPYCFLQRYHVENTADREIEFYICHTMDPSSDNLSNVEYAINHVSNTEFFSAEGYDAKVKATLSANNTYLYDNMAIVGYNNTVNEGEYRIRVKVGANQTGVLSVITGMMTTQDFSHPTRELTRILLAIKDHNLRADHNLKWVGIWNTANIAITKRGDIDSRELANATQSVEMVQRNIKYSLYNIFSIVRDDVNVDMNVLNLSAIDMNGDIYWDAEMFLIPILIILRPACARVLLNFRYHQMQFALSVASVFKNEGSQYIYKEDIANYKDMFWAPSKPATAFNTGLIGVNVWNYYKMSQDKYWLRSKGFAMLENCMRFFQSLFTDEYYLKTVVSMSGYEEFDNALSRYLGISVIRNYMEACYELSLYVSEDVVNIYNNVKNSVVILERQVAMVFAWVDLPIEVNVGADSRTDLEFTDRATGEMLGVKLGGYVDKKLVVYDEIQYTFHVDTGVYIKFFDTDDVEIADNDDGDALYSSEFGFSEGTVKIMGSRLSSFKNAYRNRYTYGAQAFVRSTVRQIHNIVPRPAYDDRKYMLEVHLMFMRYYSRILFQSINPVENSSVIENNYIYHKKQELGVEDKFVENHLDGLLAQEVGLTAKKKHYIHRFEDTLEDIFHKNSTDVTRPWGNHDYHILFIFNLLTGLFKMRVKGQISDQRFYSEIFDTAPDKGGYCLPRYWQYVTVKYNGKHVVINNDFVFDDSDIPIPGEEPI